MVACQMCHLDTIDIYRRNPDQLFRQDQRPRRVVRLNVDLMLKAFEVMAFGIQQILVERDTVIIHFTVLSEMAIANRLPRRVAAVVSSSVDASTQYDSSGAQNFSAMKRTMLDAKELDLHQIPDH